MILKSSENQPSQTYKSNLTQTWHPMFPFQFLKDSHLELIKSAQNAIQNEETQFLIAVFTEDGYKRKTLEKIAKNYLKVLQNQPVNNKDTSEDISKVVKLPWIPIIGPKLRQAFKKKNIKAIFTSGPNLKSLLCRNKTKILPNSYPGISELKCTCNSAYFGETKKKILTRTIEHQRGSFKGKWDNSGATEHSLTCHEQFNWIHSKTIARENDYRRRKIREALEIKKAKHNKKEKGSI